MYISCCPVCKSEKLHCGLTGNLCFDCGYAWESVSLEKESKPNHSVSSSFLKDLEFCLLSAFFAYCVSLGASSDQFHLGGNFNVQLFNLTALRCIPMFVVSVPFSYLILRGIRRVNGFIGGR